MKRTLMLRRETLAEITAGDLANVAGGQAVTRSCSASMPLHACIGDPPTLPPTCYTFPWC